MLIPFPLTKKSTTVSSGKNFTLESFYVELLQLLSAEKAKINIYYIEECLGFTNENDFINEHLADLERWGLVDYDSENEMWQVTEKGQLVEEEICTPINWRSPS